MLIASFYTHPTCEVPLDSTLQFRCEVVLARSNAVCSESAPVRFSPKLQLETSRGVTRAILGAACGLTLMKQIQAWQG